MQILIFLGPPGVGKGTASKQVVHALGFHWLSTGDMLREVKRSGSQLGTQIADYIDSGRLVPDDLMIQLVSERIEQLAPSVTRLLLDGFPRTLVQATALDEMLQSHGTQVDLVIELQADQQELIRRVEGRSEIDHREDDTTATLQHRLAIFRSDTLPLIDYYRQRDKLHVIEGMGSPEVVFERIKCCIQQHLSSPKDPPSEQ